MALSFLWTFSSIPKYCALRFSYLITFQVYPSGKHPYEVFLNYGFIDVANPTSLRQESRVHSPTYGNPGVNFTNEFFVLNFRAKLFCTYILSLNFFVQEYWHKCVQKMLVKLTTVNSWSGDESGNQITQKIDYIMTLGRWNKEVDEFRWVLNLETSLRLI